MTTNKSTLQVALLIFPLITAIISVGCAQQAAPSRSEQLTALLLHFDGNLQDASEWQHEVKPVGDAPQFAEGKFGQALKLDSSSGLSISNHGALHVGKQSWTAEAWVKPDREQPNHATILAGGWGLERHYGIRISNGKNLVAYFSGGAGRGGYAASGDLSGVLFDGNWHHVAAVLDQSRFGEVRLYLDGKLVETERVFSAAPEFESGEMGLAIGISAPWTEAKDLYRGLIDEVRISNVVRPEYSLAEKLPDSARPAWLVPYQFNYDPADSKKPLTLAPQSTLMALHGGAVEQNTRIAAELLQKYLRQIYGVQDGFSIVDEAQVKSLDGKAIIALGRSQWAGGDKVEKLSPDGFSVERKANVVTIAGGQSSGTLYGVVDFLDKELGVRFYMPGELWTSTPAASSVTLGEIKRLVEPFVKTAFMTDVAYYVEGGEEWAERNGTFRRRGGSHQHTMYQVFPPERYAEKYPEIYPIVNGVRTIPKDPRDQKWQPDFTAPQLLDAAEDSALRYFRQYPNHTYLAFSIMDDDVYDESPRSLAAIAAWEKKLGNREQARTAAYSEMYWKFLDALAKRLEKKLPNKLIVGLAYSQVRNVPNFKLHPNIVVYTNFHVAELEADKILVSGADGVSPLGQWLQIANHYGNHDWLQGNGYLIPRSYTKYFSEFMKAIKANGVADSFQHAEGYAHWGLDGPKYYIVNKLWWDPDADVKALWKQFSQDMFGPAAAPMAEYFATLEELWALLDNKEGPERKLWTWSTQFVTTPQSYALVKEARGHLNRAQDLAQTAQQKERVSLFSKTYKVSEYLFDFAQAPATDAQIAEAKKYFAEVIIPDPMMLHRDSRKPDVFDAAIKGAIASRL